MKATLYPESRRCHWRLSFWLSTSAEIACASAFQKFFESTVIHYKWFYYRYLQIHFAEEINESHPTLWRDVRRPQQAISILIPFLASVESGFQESLTRFLLRNKVMFEIKSGRNQPMGSTDFNDVSAVTSNGSCITRRFDHSKEQVFHSIHNWTARGAGWIYINLQTCFSCFSFVNNSSDNWPWTHN